MEQFVSHISAEAVFAKAAESKQRVWTSKGQRGQGTQSADNSQQLNRLKIESRLAGANEHPKVLQPNAIPCPEPVRRSIRAGVDCGHGKKISLWRRAIISFIPFREAEIFLFIHNENAIKSLTYNSLILRVHVLFDKVMEDCDDVGHVAVAWRLLLKPLSKGDRVSGKAICSCSAQAGHGRMRKV
jgi:hypothetical protein